MTQDKITCTSKPFILVYLISIFIIPPILIAIGIIPKSATNILRTLAICTSVCIGIMFYEKWNIGDWDFKIPKNKILKMVIGYLVFTITGILFLYCCSKKLDYKENTGLFRNPHFWRFFFPLCILQIISYRVFLFKKLELFTKNTFWLVTLNATIFAVMHVMFSIPFITVCFIGGLGMGWIYLENKSSVLMVSSHLILNFTAAYLGFFPV